MPRRLPLSFALFACIAAGAWAGPKGNWDSVSSTRFYTPTPVASDDTVNPVRGYHRWQNQELVPQSSSALDAFRRYYWRDLEAIEGQYTFGAILEDIRAARLAGRKYAFRLRMMAGYDDDQQYGPAYLPNHARCASACGFWGDADAADPGLTWFPTTTIPSSRNAHGPCSSRWQGRSTVPMRSPGSTSASTASMANGRCVPASTATRRRPSYRPPMPASAPMQRCTSMPSPPGSW